MTFQWLIESHMVQGTPDVSLRQEHDSTELCRRGRNTQTKNRKFFSVTRRAINRPTYHNQCLDQNRKRKTFSRNRKQTQLLTIECKHKSSTSNCHNKPFLNVVTYAQILSIQLISFVNFLKLFFVLRFAF